MKIFILLFASIAAIAADTQPLPVTAECQAVVRPAPHPNGIIQVTLHYDLAKCEDVQYKGGGVVIRRLLNPNLGTWDTLYIPAHRIETVVVEPKPK